MAPNKKRKVRVSFHKNRSARARSNDFTNTHADAAADAHASERLSGKGELSRQRTVISVTDASGEDTLHVDDAGCMIGRVLWIAGSNRAVVATPDGSTLNCTVRRVLRTMSRDARNLVVAGDRVLVRPTSTTAGSIVRIEPRTSSISRTAGRFEQVITANVDQALVVVSADDPPLKLGVVDRFLAGVEKGGVRGVVCINKVDLVSPVLLQPIAGQYARIGYEVLLVSATRGIGLDQLRAALAGRQSVVAGQSGVGKSSLLNMAFPGLDRRTGGVAAETGKGTHTTRVAELIPLDAGGWVVDTPGFRKLALWDAPREELEGLFVEIRPYVPGCKFPSCSHTHEIGCAVKAAADRGDISPLRYEGYVRIAESDSIGTDRD